MNDLKAKDIAVWKSISVVGSITCRPHGRNKAFHIIAFHNVVEKWGYATTKSPATVNKLPIAKIAWLLFIWPRFTFDINKCENDSYFHIKLLDKLVYPIYGIICFDLFQTFCCLHEIWKMNEKKPENHHEHKQ